MTQISLPITSRSANDDNLFSDVYGNDLAIANVVNGGLDGTNFTGGSVSGTDIASGTITDAHLASGNNHTYKLLGQDAGSIHATSGIFPTGVCTLGGSCIQSGVDASAHPPSLINLNSLLQPVGAKTQKLRVSATCVNNDTAPGIDIWVGLYPILAIHTPSGGGISYTLDTALAGSQFAFSSLAASGREALSSDFQMPITGTYCLAVSMAVGAAAGFVAQVNLQLLTHNL